MKHIPDSSIPGRPYDWHKKITCEHCKELIRNQRDELCKKYGWKTWPDDLKGALEGE